MAPECALGCCTLAASSASVELVRLPSDAGRPGNERPAAVAAAASWLASAPCKLDNEFDRCWALEFKLDAAFEDEFDDDRLWWAWCKFCWREEFCCCWTANWPRPANMLGSRLILPLANKFETFAIKLFMFRPPGAPGLPAEANGLKFIRGCSCR